MKRSHRKTIYTLAILLAIFFALLTSLNFKSKDILAINDQDFKLSLVDVLDDSNSYFDLVKVSAISSEHGLIEPEIEINITKEVDISNYLDSYNWDKKLLEDLLEANKEALDIYSQAFDKKVFQYALSANPDDISINLPIVAINSWRQLAYLSSIKAIYLARQGSIELALEEAMKSIVIAQQIEGSKNLLTITYLLALDMKKIGLKTFDFLSDNFELDFDLNQLANYYTLSNTDIFKTNYLVLKKSLTEDEISHSYYYKPNQTLELLYYAFRSQADRFKIPCWEEIPSAKPFKISSYTSIFTENVIGKLLVNNAVNEIAFQSMRRKRCELDHLINKIINK